MKANKTYHPELSNGRWHTMTIAEQLGNVGSEYERALSWKERGDKDRFEPAFARLLELLNLTITDPRWRKHRLKELTRLREVICDELLTKFPSSFTHLTYDSIFCILEFWLEANEIKRPMKLV